MKNTILIVLTFFLCSFYINCMEKFKKGKNFRQSSSQISLSYAIEFGMIQEALQLIKNGADVNQRDKCGRTPLMAAAYKGCLQLIEPLIKKGAHLEAADDKGITALLYAVSYRSKEVIKVLLAQGANIRAQSKEGNTAFFAAISNQDSEIIRELLKAEPKIIDEYNARGDTPLTFAIRLESLSMIELLLAYGADVTLTEKSKGFSPLWAATDKKYKAIVHRLLKKGANVNQQCSEGRTVLMVAASKGYIDIVKVLLDAGALVNVQPIDGWTALMDAAQNGHTHVVTELIKRGADVALQSISGETAVLSAVKRGHARIVELLIEAGADIHVKTYDNWNALMLACCNGPRTLVESLLKLKVDHSLSDSKYGLTPLHIALLNGHTESALMLIEAQANIHSKTNKGETALMCAAMEGDEKLVEVLIHCGAHVNEKDYKGRTALAKAAKDKKMRVVEMLINAGANVEGVPLLNILLAKKEDVHIPKVLQDEETIPLAMSYKREGDEVIVNSCTFIPGSSMMLYAKFGAGKLVSLAKDHLIPSNNLKEESGNIVDILITLMLKGNSELVQKMLEQSPFDVNMMSTDGKALLMTAALCNHISLATTLINQGACVDAQDTTGDTALTLATVKGHLDMVNVLVSAGAAIKNVAPLLPILVKKGYLDVLNELITLGVSDNQEYSKLIHLLKQRELSLRFDSCLKCKAISPVSMRSKQCAQCLFVRYCSIKCQKEDWPTHKSMCPELKELVQKLRTTT